METDVHNGSPPAHSVLLAVVATAACLVVCGWNTFGALLRIYRTDGDFSHGLLVPVVAVYLFYRRRQALADAAGGPAWAGPPVLVAGCLLIIVGQWYGIALAPGYLGFVFLSGLGMLLAFWGLCWTWVGASGMRVAAPVLAFLTFALPLPESATVLLTLPLRRLVSSLSAGLLGVSGVDVYREGNVLFLANGLVGVDEACSGIRSLWVLLAAACALMLLLRLRPGRAVALLLAVPLLAIGANTLRVFATALALAANHPQLAAGRIHEWLGLLTTGVAGAGLVALAWFLVESARASPAAREAASDRAPAAAARRHPWAYAAAGALLSLTAIANHLIARHYASAYGEEAAAPPRKWLSEFPAAVGSFDRVKLHALTPKEQSDLQPSDFFVGEYASPQGEVVQLSIFYWSPLNVSPRNRYRIMPRPHWPELCYEGIGWELKKQSVMSGLPAGLQGRGLRVLDFGKAGEALVVVYWREGDETSPRAVTRFFVPERLAERAAALLRSWKHPPHYTRRAQHSVTAAVRVRETRESALLTAMGFIKAVTPLLPEYGIDATAPDVAAPF